MRQPYRLLTLGLALRAVAAVVGEFILLDRSRTADVGAEVGKWLLTVAAALVLTGALSMVVKQIDQRRSERQAWHGVLNDLVAANQKFVLAWVRLQAHRSARTPPEPGDRRASLAKVRWRSLPARGA
jgi:chromate transport protein ChrA